MVTKLLVARPTRAGIHHISNLDRERLLNRRHGLNIAFGIKRLPECEAPIDHRMMQPERRVIRRIVQVGHVAIAAHDAMDCIVNGLETIRIAHARVHPGFVPEFSEIVIISEQIVQAVLERYAVVVKHRSDKIILAGGVHIPAGRVALCLIPRSKLPSIVSF